MSRSNQGVGIFGYGSLRGEPGEDIGPHIIEHMPHISPWTIEYARRSDGRGGGPTLVIHQAGGAVNGQVLVLDVGANRLAEVRVWLWERENKPKQRCIKEMRLADLDHVLYCDIESNIRVADINAESLARFAIESVSTKPERNGIAYLARNIEMGVITPLTYAYQDAILRLTGCSDLDEAESQVKSRRLTI